MKKLIAGVIAAFLMATGLAALVAAPAGAAACPYTGCIQTFTGVNAVDAARPGKVRVNFRVRTAGNAIPRGTVRIIIKSSDTFRAKNVSYPDRHRVTFLRLPDGRYSVIAKFIPGSNTAFGRSRDTTSVTVS